MITQARLKELLRYDHVTGVFTWIGRSAKNNRVTIGKIAGQIHKYGYVKISIDSRRYMAHRLAWLYVHGCLPRKFIDHVNNVRHDNRLCNLREATVVENARNATLREDNKSGIKGVYQNKRNGKWIAGLRINGKPTQLGTFDTKEKAFDVVHLVRKNLHANFSNDGGMNLAG